MEFVDGRNLSEEVAARGPLPVGEACSYAAQAAKGLQHAHEKGTVHRDVKPHNLLLTRAGGEPVVKVADFGLAKRVEDDVRLTRNGEAMGTPDYIAPEQAKNAADADIRADVYSLGCTLYFLLTGRPPFPGGTANEKFLKHYLEEPPPVADARGRDDVPPGVAAVLAKMMAKQPADRYQTPGEVAAALLPFAHMTGTADPLPSCPPTTVPEADTLIPQDTVPNTARPDVTPLPAAVRSAGKDKNRRRAWMKVAAGVVFAGMVGVLAGMVVTIKTDRGTLVVGNVPDGATVIVDGQSAKITGRDGDTLTIAAAPGRHNIEIVTGGKTIFAKDDIVATVDGKPVEVTFVPGGTTGAAAPQASVSYSKLTGFVGNGPRPPPLDCTGEDGVSPAGAKQAQEAWAKYLGTKVEENFEIAPGVSMEFVLVPPGKFWMGSPGFEKDRTEDEPIHRVRLTDPFYIGKYEVTQLQYEAIFGRDGNPSSNTGPTRPVDMVTWGQATEFAKKASLRRPLRLPTEAEWEFSCRGGRPKTMPFGVGNGHTLTPAQENVGNLNKGSRPVGSYTANAFGVSDMHGNVAEYVADGHNANYGISSPESENPKIPVTVNTVVVRGGSWSDQEIMKNCRSASRRGVGTAYGQEFYGFRLAADAIVR